jgi:hypothetical protein
MSKTILVYHPRQTGDVIMGTHIARLLKKKHDGNVIFLTSPNLVELIEPTPWLDIVLPIENLTKVSQKEAKTLKQWQIFDLIDQKLFDKYQELFEPDIAAFPKVDVIKTTTPYKPPYMLRCYCDSAGVLDLADDTEFELPLQSEEIEFGNQWWYNKGFRDCTKVLLHRDQLDSSFDDLLKLSVAADLNTRNAWRINLAIMGAADLVITRFGGVAIASAAVRTPTLTIPKPEPAWWAHPIYSHPHDGHITMWPPKHCEEFNNRFQPCYLGWSRPDWHPELCPFKFSQHCWKSITIKDVLSLLSRRFGIETN